MKPLPTSSELWAGRKHPLSTDETKLRQCKLGELCWVARVSRPDICSRLARVASRINALCGGDVRRVNQLVRVAKEWQRASVLTYASPCRPWKTLGGGGKAKVDHCNRGKKVHSGLMSLGGWSDAAYGNRSTWEMPIGFCDRLDVVDIVGPAAYFAMDFEAYPGAGQNHLGW